MKSLIDYKLKKKIQNNKGETISETLVSLLIASLALVVLAGAISAASGIITRSRTRLDNYYQNAEYITKMSGDIPAAESGSETTISSGNANLSISLPSSDTTVLSVTVTYYKNAEFGRAPVISYKK